MLLGFICRHPTFAAKAPRRTWRMALRMKAYARRVKWCEYTKRFGKLKPIGPVHHRIPFWICPELGDEERNFIGYADAHVHYIDGHGNRNWKYFNPALITEELRTLALSHGCDIQKYIDENRNNDEKEPFCPTPAFA